MPLPGPRISLLVLCQVFLCWLEAYLISKISLIGRVGIATVHQEYKLLRSGWKTFLLLLTIQIAVIFLLNLIQKKYSKKVMTVAASSLLALATLGLFVTFQDFLHTYTHRLLKERFHLGFYLFWLAWIATCTFFLVIKDGKKAKDAAPFPLDPNIPKTKASPSEIPF